MSKSKILIIYVAAHLSMLAFALEGQTIDEGLFTLSAKVQKNADGTISLYASSPRPLYQALDTIAGNLPIAVDYEDPKYAESEMHGPSGADRRLNGGSFEATLDLRRATDKASSEEAVRALVSQFNRQSRVHFKVEIYEQFSRIDVVSEDSGQVALFDTKILLDGKQRSISDTIDMILREVSQKTGTCVARSGFIDNETNARSIAIQTPVSKPARQLLAEALNSAEAEKSWLAAYEPSDGCFYVALSSRNIHRTQPK